MLVVGGGLAGCWASYRAAQLEADVVLAEKGHTGSSGCSTFAGGDILWWTPSDNLSEWLANYARWGGYLFDPRWFVILCNDIYKRVLEMKHWGAPFEKDEQGNLVRKPGRGHNAAVVFPGIDLMELMRKKVQGKGVRMLDHVMITDLVSNDEGVIGAVGFHIRSGEFFLIRAKAVILAAGGCSWRGNYFGQDMVCGEAYSMAYRHGAELMHMEYSNNYNSTYRYFDIYGMSRFQRLGGKFTNARGDRFMARYDPELGDGSHLHTLAIAMAKEVREGRGPIYFDLRDMKEEDRHLSRKLLPLLFDMFNQAQIDIFGRPLEWIPGFQGTVATGSGIRLMDYNCATNVNGLFAAGDAACEGLVIGGITGPGAINLSWAIVTGYRAGEGAAHLARDRGQGGPSRQLLDELKDRTFVHLRKKGGKLSPQDVYYRLQDITIGWDKNIIRHGKRLKTSLEELEQVRAEMIPRMRVDDFHQLMRAHEVEATHLTTEMITRSALFRTESRASHYREDFPETDNVNWLKWIVVKKSGKGMELIKINAPIKAFKEHNVSLPC